MTLFDILYYIDDRSPIYVPDDKQDPKEVIDMIPDLITLGLAKYGEDEDSSSLYLTESTVKKINKILCERLYNYIKSMNDIDLRTKFTETEIRFLRYNTNLAMSSYIDFSRRSSRDIVTYYMELGKHIDYEK